MNLMELFGGDHSGAPTVPETSSTPADRAPPLTLAGAAVGTWTCIAGALHELPAVSAHRARGRYYACICQLKKAGEPRAHEVLQP